MNDYFIKSQILSYGVPVDSDLALINENAHKPLKAEDVFVFPTVMATSELTCYGYHLGATSLRNFAKAAQSGVPYHLMHERAVAPYGYTFLGSYDPAESKALGKVYIPRGRYPLGKDQRSANQEIADIEQGLRREVSAGFGGNEIELRCDICGNELMGDGCEHLPGLKYNGLKATFTVEGGRLTELSGVDKGGCPGAIILKAQRLNAPSKYGLAAFREWTELMQVSDWTRQTSIPSNLGSNISKETNVMREKLEKLAAQLTAKGLTALAAQVLALGSDDDLGTGLADLIVQQLSAARQEASTSNPLVLACQTSQINSVDDLNAVRTLAAEGVRLGKVCRENAVKEAVRALGAEGAKEVPTLLEKLPIDTVLSLENTWRLTANAKHDIPDDGNAASRQTAPTAHALVGTDASTAQAAQASMERQKQLLELTPLGREALSTTEGGK